jgi:serine/threonine-protein kinase
VASCPVPIGETLSGKYRIERILGEGGMGVVVAAHHLELDQPVAIKFLLEGLADKEEGAERFRREARAAAKIHSDHVVRVLDVGGMADGVRYMVMEYLEGSDLAQELAERGPFPLGAACGFILEAIDAVGHGHAVGIVHRDLKPANLFLANRPDGSRRIKVLDFGISKRGTSSRPYSSAMMSLQSSMHTSQM